MGEQTKFATKLGIIATTVGSAVGLGNIWRFPYEAGMNGGGAFLMVYILCVLILGIPVMCAEFVIGRRSKSDTVDAFRKLAPGTRWHYIGYIGILASVLILGYYMVISGWTLEYLFKAFTNDLAGKTAAEFKAEQNAFIQSDFRPLLWAYIFLFITISSCREGYRKVSRRCPTYSCHCSLSYSLSFACARSRCQVPAKGSLSSSTPTSPRSRHKSSYGPWGKPSSR